MRQPGLGKEEWLAVDLKRKEKNKKAKDETPVYEKKQAVKAKEEKKKK
jgi:hypothetical protein